MTNLKRDVRAWLLGQGPKPHRAAWRRADAPAVATTSDAIPGVKVKHGGTYIQYTGSADALVASKLVTREEVPGELGCPRKSKIHFERGEHDLRLERQGQLVHLLVYLSSAEIKAAQARETAANRPKGRRSCSARNYSGQWPREHCRWEPPRYCDRMYYRGARVDHRPPQRKRPLRSTQARFRLSG